MLVFNQQANIKNVNGAIADIFANRPAAQSTFYLFYATDTQEIYYDNGAWVLLGSGGGGGINIYNSNGTLSANRFVNGNSKLLLFNNLSQFGFTNSLFQNIGLNLALQSSIYEFGAINSLNKTTFTIDDNNQLVKTSNQGNDIGLKLDFANNEYYFGDTLNTNFLEVIGNSLSLNSQSNRIQIDGNNNEISTFCNNQNIGLFANPSNVVIGDTLLNNSIFFDLINNLITTKYSGSDIGLKLDFSNQQYILGDIINLNSAALFVDAIQGSILGYEANVGNNGINVVPKFGNVTLGDFGAVGNQTILQIDNQSNLIKTQYLANDIGLYMDFANSTYEFGQLTGGNATNFIINDITQQFYTLFNSLNIGFFINGQTNSVLLGNMDATNKLHLTINDNLETAYFTHQLNTYQGLLLNFNNNTYQFGRITGGNTTTIKIDDAAAYPLQTNGTNLLSGTSGGNSGQHLKIKINGVDYKIALLNP